LFFLFFFAFFVLFFFFQPEPHIIHQILSELYLAEHKKYLNNMYRS
jgi:hypothetical protein